MLRRKHGYRIDRAFRAISLGFAGLVVVVAEASENATG